MTVILSPQLENYQYNITIRECIEMQKYQNSKLNNTLKTNTAAMRIFLFNFKLDPKLRQILPYLCQGVGGFPSSLYKSDYGI